MFLCFAEQITSARGYIKKASVCFVSRMGLVW